MKSKKLTPYDPKKIEKKWQKEWTKKKTYKTKETKGKKSCYVLDMFPYPSGDGLHVGHPKGYIATDIYSRYKSLQGFNILHPMGWDAFGLPAENYAIKNKVHPEVAVKKNIKRFKEQLSKIGFNYDWDREISTTDPEYYRWTQWIFLQMYKKGLAFESNEPINWCPSCKTGLANEDLEDGKCERCGSVVEQKPLRQWVLKITDYADRMLEDLNLLPKWPVSIKEAQKNWIGRSEGVNFKCKIKDLNIEVKMYNSVPQTYHAETFTVIAPDHPLVSTLIKGMPEEKEVLEFVERIKRKKAENKFDIEKDLEGIFTGRYIENFADTGRDLPIWIASYVLANYGTGIVNASAHDLRDFAFAKKYNIPLSPVMFPIDAIEAEKIKNLEYSYAKDPQGVLQEPLKFRGRKWGEARQDIINHIVEKGFGERKVNYKLRDWVFSRQRYWGEPIPLVHCPKCGVVPVPEKDLPVKLPKVKNYEPTGTGESPLAGIDKWVNVKCPKCKGKAKRETNTMPQWAGSCWYYLRFIDPKNKKSLVDPKKEKLFMPVSVYVGGAEHATRHLIYARFWHKFLYDQKIVSGKEPFDQLYSVGLIAGEDGRKMSKRYGNVINPDDIVALYGADTLRIYEMFMGPFAGGIAWSTNSMIGTRRFLDRVWAMQEFVGKEENNDVTVTLHKTIKKVGEDIETFSFNTAVSSMMIFVNTVYESKSITKKSFESFLTILSVFAPHITEQIWNNLGNKKTIFENSWPAFKKELLIEEKVTVVVQVNGKIKAEMSIDRDIDDDAAKTIALGNSKVAEFVGNSEIKRVIVVKNRLINIVI